jgi:opacity protein-like surface antigen
MKKIIFTLLFFVSFLIAVGNNSEKIQLFDINKTNLITKDTSFTPSGKPIIQFFGNFNYNPTQDVTKRLGFYITRAYLGYEYQFSKQFIGKIVIDAGRPTTVGTLMVWDSSGNQMFVSNTSKEGSFYTMFLKFAYLEWAPSSKFKIIAGAIPLNHYITQEKFWRYRYVAETFQDRYLKTPSADIGMIAYYKPYSKLGFDLAITNGEGFKLDQDQFSDFKVGAGIDLNLFKNWKNRLYYDFHKGQNPNLSELQQTVSFFTGYEWKEKLRVGLDLTWRINNNNLITQNIYGYSIFGVYDWTPKWGAMVRLDQVFSDRDQLELPGWSYQVDGMGLIGGIQYSPISKMKFSLNYQGFKPNNSILVFQHNLFLNMEFSL